MGNSTSDQQLATETHVLMTYRAEESDQESDHATDTKSNRRSKRRYRSRRHRSKNISTNFLPSPSLSSNPYKWTKNKGFQEMGDDAVYTTTPRDNNSIGFEMKNESASEPDHKFSLSHTEDIFKFHDEKSVVLWSQKNSEVEGKRGYIEYEIKNIKEEADKFQYTHDEDIDVFGKEAEISSGKGDNSSQQ